jgi:hypothetical protein
MRTYGLCLRAFHHYLTDECTYRVEGCRLNGRQVNKKGKEKIKHLKDSVKKCRIIRCSLDACAYHYKTGHGYRFIKRRDKNHCNASYTPIYITKIKFKILYSVYFSHYFEVPIHYSHLTMICIRCSCNVYFSFTSGFKSR